ncbi:TolC family protein [Tellurirhabdus rosea]|uniref:TolC family protein n=1 Tax=Tellurirhabdus rosea TaxID=2674997 RepID=UPI0022592A13|nr:TolC family protein [Tellurirhabdus rosea]
MKSIAKIIGIALALGAAAVQAQPVPDELKTLLTQAHANFPRLKEQAQQLKAGQIRVDVARSGFLPTVAATAGYQYINPVPKPTLPLNGREVTLQFMPNHNLNAQVGVSQTIYDFGRTETAIRRAQDDVQALVHSLEMTRHNLDYQVAAAYYGMAFLQKSMVVQDSVIRVVGQNLQIIANRLRNGDALEFDILTQQVRLETAKNRRIDLENGLEKQRALLAYLTGAPVPTLNAATVPLETAVTLVNPESAMQAAQTGNKELQLVADRLRAAQTDVEVARKAGLPNITFQGATGYKNGYLPDINQLRFNVAAGVNLNVPIYSGKRARLQQQAASITVAANQFAFENASAQLRQTLDQLNADIRSNQQKLQNTNTQVLQARKALEIARTRLKNGVITNVELESAETGIEEAGLAQLSFQYQLLLNQLEVKRLLGDNL